MSPRPPSPCSTVQRHRRPRRDIYGSRVSKDLVTKVTDAELEELQQRQARPLDPAWPVVFIDAIYVKTRDGQANNRPICAAMGINAAGERDVLGMWVGTGGESAKHRAGYLTELRNRGIADAMIVACATGFLACPRRSRPPGRRRPCRPASST